MQSEFRLEVRQEPGATVIAVSGELDLASSPVLHEEVTRLLSAAEPRIVLDLRQLDFMDSTGVSVLVRAHHAAQATGTELCLVQGRPQVQRLLTLTGVAERFTILKAPGDAAGG